MIWDSVSFISLIVALAYQSAVNHGLEDIAASLRKTLPGEIPKYTKPAVALCPAKPLWQDYEKASEMMNGWPVFDISDENQVFGNIGQDEEGQEGEVAAVGIDNLEDVKKRPDDDEEEEEVVAPGKSKVQAGEKWKNDLDVDFSDDDEPAPPPVKGGKGQPAASAGTFVPKEPTIISSVKKSSNIPGEFAAVGLFQEALDRLDTQIGLKNHSNLTQQFADLFLGSEFYFSPMPFVPQVSQFITTNSTPPLPMVSNNLKAAERKLKQGYKHTAEGNFDEALSIFRDILLSIPLMALTSKADLQSAEQLINICAEYIVALSCDQEKKKSNSSDRQLELTIMMALPNLHASHRVLTLRAAMAQTFKTKNFIAAAYLARRFLKLAEDNPDLVEADVLGQAQKILQKAEKTGTNESQKASFEESLLYDNAVILRIDTSDLTLLSKTDTVKKCPLDKTVVKAKAAGKICKVCGACEVGKETVGMKIVK